MTKSGFPLQKSGKSLVPSLQYSLPVSKEQNRFWFPTVSFAAVPDNRVTPVKTLYLGKRNIQRIFSQSG